MNQHHPGFSYSLAESRQFDSLVSKIVTATEFAFPSQEFMEDSKALGRETNPPFGGDHARTGTEPHRRGGQADESVRFGGFRKAGKTSEDMVRMECRCVERMESSCSHLSLLSRFHVIGFWQGV